MDIRNYDKEIDISTRTIKGEFYTPKLWVDYTHTYINNTLQYEWYNNIVWDCAWGTGNLTRDYKFKELYASTLKETDLIMALDNNTDSSKFQFDFLNDSLEHLEQINNKLFNKLIELDNLIFFINPPYATANKNKNQEIDKNGLSFTVTSNDMKKNNWGGTGQLYTQFLYRITEIKNYFKIKNVKILLFSPPLFLTGDSFKNFRSKFLKEFSFIKGFIFNATEFNDIDSEWGLTFSIWESGINTNNEFKFDILLNDNGNIKSKGSKILYNLDGKETFSSYMRDPIKKYKKINISPSFKSALNYTFDNKKSKVVDNFIGVLNSQGNNIKENNQSVALFSYSGSKIGTIPIVEDNLLRCVVNFTSRRIITGKKATWYNWYDEYMSPIENTEYDIWSKECLVYSLFNLKSNQSSLKIKKDDGEIIRIENNFFWIKPEDLNIKINEKRYIANYLDINYDNLSKESKDILNFTKDIILKTLNNRLLYHKNNPQHHLNCWDAGWYQIKLLLNEYDSNLIKDFNILYKKLENYIEPGIYDFGILKK